MATNPMQKNARNSFLIGMLITLLITGAIIALLIMQLTNTKKEVEALKGAKIRICTLSQSVKSGQVITDDMVTVIEVDKGTVPSNSFKDDVNNISTYRLEDSRGNTVGTNKDGELYLPKINEQTGDFVTTQTGEIEQRIISSPDGENYYYEDTGEKVELITVPLVAKVDLEKNSILTNTVVAKSDSALQSDVRKMEYNMIVLPSQLETNSYIDIRLSLPNGQDFIVVSHKQIEIPNVDGTDSLSTIWLNLNETEILTLNCAIVESYKMPGSKLYVAQYVEPGLQDAAKITYVPSDDTLRLIRTDPNCLQEAKTALWERIYNKNASGQYTTKNEDVESAVRNPINSTINENQDSASDNVNTGVQNDIQKTQEERQKYLESLGGTY